MSDTSERADRFLRALPARHPDDYRPAVTHSPRASAELLRLRVARLEGENEALRAEVATLRVYAADVTRERDRLRAAWRRERERLAWAVVAAAVLALLLTMQFVVR